jgi:hypothetical protein
MKNSTIVKKHKPQSAFAKRLDRLMERYYRLGVRSAYVSMTAHLWQLPKPFKSEKTVMAECMKWWREDDKKHSARKR